MKHPSSTQSLLLVVLKLGVNVANEFENVRHNVAQSGIVVNHKDIGRVSANSRKFRLGRLADSDCDVSRRFVRSEAPNNRVQRRR